MSGGSSPARIAAAKPTLWQNPWLLLGIMGVLLILTGMGQGWIYSLTILQLCLISAVMALGVNVQWGYAGLFNAGTMGFAALGGLAAILVAQPPVMEAWAVGGGGILLSFLVLIATIAAVVFARSRLASLPRLLATLGILVVGYFVFGAVFNPASNAIEGVNPAQTGYLGGAGLPILFSWFVGGLFAAVDSRWPA